jgi:hypothetical protein
VSKRVPCCVPRILLILKWVSKEGFFGGEGFVLQALTGEGDVFLKGAGGTGLTGVEGRATSCFNGLPGWFYTQRRSGYGKSSLLLVAVYAGLECDANTCICFFVLLQMSK